MSLLKPIVATEYQEHITLVEWIEKTQPLIKHLYFHIPNGGSRPKIRMQEKNGKNKFICLEGVRLKKMGVKKGVFDFFFPIANKHYHGLFIELKRKIQSASSKEQKEFQSAVIERGYAAIFCYGWEHAKKVIEGYLRDAHYDLSS